VWLVTMTRLLLESLHQQTHAVPNGPDAGSFKGPSLGAVAGRTRALVGQTCHMIESRRAACLKQHTMKL
jgi:hypothetical protein